MRWTVDDVRRMVESGGFQNPERYELVEGLIVDKMSQNAPHRTALRLVLAAMRGVFAGRAEALAGVPLPLAATNEPEPDVIVAAPVGKEDLRVEDVRLVVEVADTSLRKDQTSKAALYARHGIPEYVLLDVVNRRAEIRRYPDPTRETWGETLILTEDREFTPLGASGPLRVSDLLPDL